MLAISGEGMADVTSREPQLLAATHTAEVEDLADATLNAYYNASGQATGSTKMI
jgi:hypothetical protein